MNKKIAQNIGLWSAALWRAPTIIAVPRRTISLALFLLVGSITLAPRSSSAQSTWTGLGADSNWSTAGNWDHDAVPIFPTSVTFAGNTQLTNNNDLANITMGNITFDAAAGAFVLDGDDITLNGNISFNGNPATPVAQTINLGMAWNTSRTIDTPANGNLNLGGAITSTSDFSLVKIDDGTLTLSGDTMIQSWDLNGGTTIIAGNTAINGTGNSRVYVGDGDSLPNCKATLIIQPGAVLTIGGVFSDTFVIGRDSGSGKIIQNGGTFTFNPVSDQTLLLIATGNTNSYAEYDMNGGLLDMAQNVFTIGWGSAKVTAALNQVSGVITNLGQLEIPITSGGGGLGIYNLSGGSNYIGSGGITTAGGNSKYSVNLGGGTVGAYASWSSSLNMNLTNLNGSVTFDTAGNTIALSGALSGNGGLTVAGPGTLRLSGINMYTGDTIVNAGSTLEVDSPSGLPGTLRLANGAMINLNYSGTTAFGALYTNNVALPLGVYNAGNLPAFITGGGALLVTTNLSRGTWTGLGADSNWSTAGNWDHDAVPIFPTSVTFAGNTQLTNNNDLANITMGNITFDAAAGAFVLDGDDITLNGNISFNGNPATPVAQTINLGMAWNTSRTIDTPANGNLNLGGAITSTSDFSLVKIDDGTLTLSGDTMIQSWDLNGGTTIIAGNTAINGTGNSRVYVGDGDSLPNCKATLIIQPGAVLTIGGVFSDAFVIGRDSGSGKIIQNGGTFTFNPVNDQTLLLIATGNTNSYAEYDMNGGLLDMAQNVFTIGWGSAKVTAALNQVSGVITNLGQLEIPITSGGGGLGIYNLSGGSNYIGSGGITTAGGNSKYSVNLGGGTVGAYASWSSSLNMNLTNLNGSVTFDTAGNTIALSGALSGNGGLTVAGPGTLRLSGINMYTGDTIVNAGSTLEVDSPSGLPGTLRLANGAMINLNYSGTTAFGALYTNNVALPLGVYNAGNLPAFITGGGALLVTTNLSRGTWTGLGADSNWSTAGNWDHDAVPIFPTSVTFAGNTQLTNNNDLANITMGNITFDAAAGAFVLDGDDITLNGNISFNGNPATPVAQTINLGMAWNTSRTIDTPANGNLNLGGAITSTSDFSLVKIDDGTLTLSGDTMIQSWDLNGGTTIIAGNTAINGTGNSRVYVGDGDSLPNCKATLIIQPGAVLTIGGVFSDTFVIGRDSGSGKIIQNGGTFTFNPVSDQTLLLIATGNTNSYAEYDMNGGLLDMAQNVFTIGWGSAKVTAALNQVSGVITNLGQLEIPITSGGGGLGIYNLSGGSNYIGSGGITTAGGNSKYSVNLGGGTVGAYASWSSSLNMNLTNLNGSVTFDTAGNTIALSGALSGNGGLTVAGPGTLRLSGINMYTGDTIVNAGSTLEVDSPSGLPGTLRLANGAMINLNYSGTTAFGALYTNNVALPLGVYNAGNLPAFITGGGALLVSLPIETPDLSVSLTDGSVTINWSANYLGWILQAQTNSLGTNWVDVAGSANVNSVTPPVNPAIQEVFYRLRNP